MQILSSFSQLHVVPNLYDNLSSAEHKRRYWQPILMTTHFHFMDTKRETFLKNFNSQWSFRNHFIWWFDNLKHLKKKKKIPPVKNKVLHPLKKNNPQKQQKHTATILNWSPFQSIQYLRCNIVPFVFVRQTKSTAWYKKRESSDSFCYTNERSAKHKIHTTDNGEY